MTSSQIVGDINMGTIASIKRNIMLEYNHLKEEFGSSNRHKGLKEFSEKRSWVKST